MTDETPNADSSSPPAAVDRDRGTATQTWRIVLHGRTLPLPVLRPITIGSDDRNGIQLSHASVRPFHARLTRRAGGILVERLDDEGSLKVDDRPARRVLLSGGETLSIGQLTVRVERGEIAPAVVVRADTPASFEEEFFGAFVRELKRTPWFAISIVVHIVLLTWAERFIQEDRASPENIIITADVQRDTSMPAEVEEIALETPPELEEETDDLPEIEPDDVDVPDHPYLEDVPIQAVGIDALSNLGTGQGAEGAGGFGSRGINLRGVDGPLKGALEDYRTNGLDLVFLIDTTSSMDMFLRAAKATVDRIITDLSDLIPNVRLGVIAYRDHGDEYVTLATPISTDRYAILNFLESLHSDGGADVPEAILEAVEHALDELTWRPRAHRVLLIIADAPPHPEDMAKLRMRLKSASRSRVGRTTVSTLFTGRGQLSFNRQGEAESALREIAEAGAGEFSYLEDSNQVTQQIVSMTLGTRFRRSVAQLLSERRASPRHVLVAQKVEARDLDWLFRKISIAPVEPTVVEGLIRIGSPAVALRSHDIVADMKRPRGVREAALYILKQITRYDGNLDFTRSLTLQQNELKGLQEALERAYRQKR